MQQPVIQEHDDSMLAWCECDECGRVPIMAFMVDINTEKGMVGLGTAFLQQKMCKPLFSPASARRIAEKIRSLADLVESKG